MSVFLAFGVLAALGWYLNYRAETFYPSIVHSCAVISGVIGMFVSSMQMLVVNLYSYFFP